MRIQELVTSFRREKMKKDKHAICSPQTADLLQRQLKMHNKQEQVDAK